MYLFLLKAFLGSDIVYFGGPEDNMSRLSNCHTQGELWIYMG